MNRKLFRMFAVMTLLLMAACGSENSGTLPGPVPADNVDPQITAVNGVANGATVSGTLNITATATDNTAVTSFTLAIDGVQAATAASGALSHSWNTGGVTDGAHALVFTARDTAGNDDTEALAVTVDNSGGGGVEATVSGVVLMPNGADPVSGALVYVPQAGASAVGDPPSEPHEAYTYSGADGSFELVGVPVGEQTFKISKGGFLKVFTFDVQAGDNALAAALTTLPAASGGGNDVGAIAVVTGSFDAIENVLARLGLGDVDAGGGLVPGTETFTLIDGNSSLDDADYANFDAFFADEANFSNFRTIFLNCGNQYEFEFFADAAAVSAIKAWIQGGGRLYCTDWSYDFCEQLYPQYVDFAGDDATDGLSTIAELPDAAEIGSSMDTIEATIGDAALLAWLDGLDVVNTNNTVNVSDWLSAWSPIEAVSGDVKVWASGDITYGSPEATVTKPITITFTVGDGLVLFSSYHTEAFPQPELTPQDRILQYLVLEVL